MPGRCVQCMGALVHVLLLQVWHGILEWFIHGPCGYLLHRRWGGCVHCYMTLGTPFYWPGRTIQSLVHQLMSFRMLVISLRRWVVIVLLVWWTGIDGIVCILVLLSVFSGSVCGVSQWEWASLRHRVILLWAVHGLHTSNEHFGLYLPSCSRHV